MVMFCKMWSFGGVVAVSKRCATVDGWSVHSFTVVTNRMP